MNLQREFIKRSVAYYMSNQGCDGMTEAQARVHANADAKWLRDSLLEALRKPINRGVR